MFTAPHITNNYHCCNCCMMHIICAAYLLQCIVYNIMHLLWFLSQNKSVDSTITTTDWYHTICFALIKMPSVCFTKTHFSTLTMLFYFLAGKSNIKSLLQWWHFKTNTSSMSKYFAFKLSTIYSLSQTLSFEKTSSAEMAQRLNFNKTKVRFLSEWLQSESFRKATTRLQVTAQF